MKKFYERYWEDNENEGLNDFNMKWPVLKKLIPKQKDLVIVDYGCGNGVIIRHMIDLNPNSKFIGLDVSETALNYARKHIKEAQFLKIDDGGELPLDNDSVDFIISSEVIEHIYDTQNAFCEIRRILKPGGKVLFTTPYHGLIKNLLIVLTDFNKHFNPIGQHIRFFSRKALYQCLKNVNLESEKFGTYGRFWPIPCSMYVLAKKTSQNRVDKK